MDTPRTLRVAAVQARAALLDLDATLAHAETWVARAAREGARLVALPETFLPGYPAWLDHCRDVALWEHPGAKEVFARLLANAVEVPGAACDRLAAMAAKHRLTLVAGAQERAGRTLYNALLVFGPDGALLVHHRKLVPTYTERLLWAPGDASGLRAAEAGGVRVGGLVCWEHWMPLARQVLHDAREEVHVALWPAVGDAHHLASRHYAFEGRCFVVAVGSILRAGDLPKELPFDGPAEVLLRDGGSAIYAPDGRCLAGPVRGEEALVLADCDLAEIARESMTLDVSGHYARPDLFDVRVDRRRPSPRG